MTLPTPMGVLKSPRPLELSNLEDMSVHLKDTSYPRVDSLLASVVVASLCGIVEPPGILNGDFVALVGFVDAVAFLEELLLQALRHGEWWFEWNGM